ncbi:MAG: hypothetical protein JWL90_3024 [Chthoniobacteraceae bacterium]|nr:hypothetical protein [Chthoniobacteraceae bacterium]
MATENFWTGAAISGDWNTAGNWNLGRVPAAVNNQPAPADSYDDAVINQLNNFPSISGNLSVSPRDILVGTGTGNSGRVDQNAGSVSTGVGSWFLVGRDGGTGTYNLADTSATGGTLTGFGLSSGNLTVGGGSTTAGRVYVGGANFGPGGVGTFNVNTSGTLQIGNDLTVGSAGGTGVMNVDAGTITTGGWNFFGKEESTPGANGTLNMSGGSLTNAGRTYVGAIGSTGKMVLSGGTYKNPNDLFSIADRAGSNGTVIVNNSASLLQLGELWVGESGQSNGSMNLSAGTVTAANWIAVGREGGTGVIDISGGTFTKAGGNGSHFILGSLGGVGTTNQTGGAVSTVGNGNLLLGENAGGRGTWNISGGTASFDSARVGWAGGGQGALNVSGTGQFRVAELDIAENGNGIVTQAGGTVSISGNLDVQANGAGVYNFSGGTLSVDGAIDTSNGTFNFTGGKLTRSSAGLITVNGSLLIGNPAAGLKLDDNKTFDINGTFDISSGVTWDLSGLTVPALATTGPNTGTFTLGTVDAIIGMFEETTTTVIGFDSGGASLISEMAGENGAYNANSQSVYWIEENGGTVNLKYSVVPEPATFGLLTLGALGLAGRRRRK